MNPQIRALEAFDSWDREKGQSRPEGATPESMAAFVGRGFVGAAILLLRQAKSGTPMPPYWRDGCIKVALDLVEALQALE